MKQDITQKKVGIDFCSYDSIVIKKHITDIEGGRTLDMTGFPEDVVFAAHVIISLTSNGDKVYRPMPVVPVSGYVYTAVDKTAEGYSSKNPKTEGWYTESGGVYTLTNDTEVDNAKTYYTRSGEEYAYDDDGHKKYAYDTLPAGAVYEGVLYRSIAKDKPAASILIDGVVNDEVMKIALGSIASAFKTACPHIIFNHDEEA